MYKERRGTTVLALFFLTFGLVLAGIWTNVVGYSVNLLPFEPSLGRGSFNTDAYLWGRFFFGLVVVFLAPFIPRILSILAVAVAFIMNSATVLLILSYHQLLFDPYTLSSLSVFIAGGGYFFLISLIYILLAQRISTSQIAACIALSLVVEMVLSILISLYLDSALQAAIVVLAPLLILACYFTGERLSRHCILDEHTPKITGAAKNLLLIQIVIFAILVVLIRVLSNVGIWGSSRTNFLGMTELSVGELFVISAIVLLLAYLVFILPDKRFSLQVRCVIAFVVLLGGLQLLAFSNDYQLSLIFDSVTTAVSLFSTLAMWMVIINCIRETSVPAFRVASFARPFNAVLTLAWAHILVQQPFVTSTFVMVVVYILVIAVLAMAFGGHALDVFKPRKAGLHTSDAKPENKLLSFERTWNLTKRESEVFELLFAGKKYHDIELECELSEGTVKKHISHIYRKLNVHSKGEMLKLFNEYESAGAQQEGDTECPPPPPKKKVNLLIALAKVEIRGDQLELDLFDTLGRERPFIMERPSRALSLLKCTHFFEPQSLRRGLALRAVSWKCSTERWGRFGRWPQSSCTLLSVSQSRVI